MTGPALPGRSTGSSVKSASWLSSFSACTGACGSGATIAERLGITRVTVATWRGQGSAYSIERKVEAAKRPLISRSREIVLRGEHRIVIVQIVHDGEDLSAIDAELARVVGTLEVL